MTHIKTTVTLLTGELFIVCHSTNASGKNLTQYTDLLKRRTAALFQGKNVCRMESETIPHPIKSSLTLDRQRSSV